MDEVRQGQERRKGERRHSQRRQREQRESLPPPSRSDADAGPQTQPADSRFEALPTDGAGGEGAFARVVRVHLGARAAVGAGYLVALGLAGLSGGRATNATLLVAIAYALQAWAMWLLQNRDATDPGGRRRYWLATIGVDLTAFSALHLLGAQASFNSAALLVFPVLMAGALMPRLAALATTSAACMVLLLGAWASAPGAGELPPRLAQSGLAGMGLFVIVLLAGELAARLAREEMAARGSLALARQQAQLNRLVIEEMADGVLVVDPRLRVRALNPAARALLAAPGVAMRAPVSLDDQPAWAPLAHAVRRGFGGQAAPDAGIEVSLSFDAGLRRQLRMRMRFTRTGGDDDDGQGASETYGVLLLEDVRTAQARVRQEKLAAMGRLSAGVAHEIRNPLAAIAQANALLLEGALADDDRRLAGIVADNVHRLKRIVDDVMELAPGDVPAPGPCDARAVVTQTLADWAQTHRIETAAGARLRQELTEQDLPVVFDPEHLRRVLVNLLDNAWRHATPTAGAVFVRLAPHGAGKVLLQVFSDGEAIAPDVERHLFEPFYSTRSRGSGLGLYICRELCERYGAAIDYRGRPGAERLHNEFVVTLRRSTPTS